MLWDVYAFGYLRFRSILVVNITGILVSRYKTQTLIEKVCTALSQSPQSDGYLQLFRLSQHAVNHSTPNTATLKPGLYIQVIQIEMIGIMLHHKETAKHTFYDNFLVSCGTNESRNRDLTRSSSKRPTCCRPGFIALARSSASSCASPVVQASKSIG